MSDERTTHHHLKAAKERLRDADQQLLYLAGATSNLHHPAEASEREEEVRSPYLAWLVFVRQVSASINDAWEAASKPEQMREWWGSLWEDERHKYFRDSRNDGLKNGDPVIGEEPIVDDELGEFGFFTFASGPFVGMPLAPICKEYTDWLYTNCLCVAQDQLFEHFKDDAKAELQSRP